MTWAALALALRWVIGAWFALTAGAILIGILDRRILVRGMLRERLEASFDFHRIQQFVTVLAFAVGYVVTALARPTDGRLPDISPVILGALLASHATYVGGKYFNRHKHKRETDR